MLNSRNKALSQRLLDTLGTCMFKPIGITFLWLVSLPALAACLTDAQLTQLNQKETAYMLGRIPPAFAHALEDKKLIIETKSAIDEPCTANLTIAIPEADLAEANKILDADIAKKIMLTGQGYSLPESTQVQASYLVAQEKGGPAEKEELQTKPLGKLRASVELMYATLTQARAEVKEDQQNAQPWRDEFKAKQVASCQQTMSAQQAIDTACFCQANGLEAMVSQRQLDYLNYIKSNPYAMATGSDKTFNIRLEKLNDQCGLKTKRPNS